ncbi:MAG: cellulose synthase family protein [Bacteroidota bacterium]
MPSWGWVVIGVYGVGMIFIFCYSLVQLSLLLNYRKRNSSSAKKWKGEWPSVLIQLPVFNERYVVERLIDATCKLDYPKDKLSIQLLDDSTDDSFEIATEIVQKYAVKGINIEQVKREERVGFKAGALQYGLGHTDAEFVSIFDADFVPDPGFLKRAIPEFMDENIGMVQSRWGHLNRDYSLLTRVQAFALDAHFTVEQMGRNIGNHFINFNGTAGIWRKVCIEDAGGWSADTLTEDLDLSYRAQLKGWKFKFLEEVVSPAELPAEMNALKNQQYRWNKGAAECAKKHVRNVLKSKTISASTKIHAFFHLLNSSIFIWIVICALLSLPLIILKNEVVGYEILFASGGILLFSFFVLAFFYYTAFKRIKTAPTKTFFWLYPAFLSLSMGMSLHNARAVLQGYFGKRTPFVRTPKWNLIGNTGSFRQKMYIDKKIPFISWVEGFLGLYFLLALIVGLRLGEWGFIPLHAMLVFGFFAVFHYSVKHAS